jgi:hypothetical protein
MILENINGKEIVEFPNRSQAFNDQQRQICLYFAYN